MSAIDVNSYAVDLERGIIILSTTILNAVREQTLEGGSVIPWLHVNNIYYYSKAGKRFSKAEAVQKAMNSGATYLVMENTILKPGEAV